MTLWQILDKKFNKVKGILYMVFLIFVIQFVDSYCTELFGKLQSFSISDFIIQGE